MAYLIMAAAGAATAATLYRFGSAHQTARWQWISPGTALASSRWVLLTIGFGTYVTHFGKPEHTSKG